MKRMYTVCAGIPYSTAAKANHTMRERDYQIAFYIIFTLMVYHVDLESHTAQGRADLVVRTSNCVYIFEFKLMSAATAEEALNQIKEKGDADKYRLSGKKIIGIGAVFGDGISNETPDTWKMEELT
ncbi:MAG: PD-(D/E)XK nuclease domain-containing protein [Treponema sp.]|uniref:PD-(D/E)XK nuclease domain-containing protein n=1 Tax=Treponema sp. TaxID=166 RepID=UPI003FA21459